MYCKRKCVGIFPDICRLQRKYPAPSQVIDVWSIVLELRAHIAPFVTVRDTGICTYRIQFAYELVSYHSFGLEKCSCCLDLSEFANIFPAI